MYLWRHHHDVCSPKGVCGLQVPTWSDKDGQDDIRWYEATRQANGDYKVSVKAEDHKQTLTSVSTMFIFTIFKMMVLVGVGSTTTEVEFEMLRPHTNRDQECQFSAGTYTVTVVAP